jgi:hypothetical protein
VYCFLTRFYSTWLVCGVVVKHLIVATFICSRREHSRIRTDFSDIRVYQNIDLVSTMIFQKTEECKVNVALCII